MPREAQGSLLPWPLQDLCFHFSVGQSRITSVSIWQFKPISKAKDQIKRHQKSAMSNKGRIWKQLNNCEIPQTEESKRKLCWGQGKWHDFGFPLQSPGKAQWKILLQNAAPEPGEVARRLRALLLQKARIWFPGPLLLKTVIIARIQRTPSSGFYGHCT